MNYIALTFHQRSPLLRMLQTTAIMLNSVPLVPCVAFLQVQTLSVSLLRNDAE